MGYKANKERHTKKQNSYGYEDKQIRLMEDRAEV